MKQWWSQIKESFSKKKNNKTTEIYELTLSKETWWGNITVEPEQSRYVKMSSLLLFIDHYNQEWHVTCREELKNAEIKSKFVLKNPGNEIFLSPTLYDRSLLSNLT